jgi:hypothetical protein
MDARAGHLVHPQSPPIVLINAAVAALRYVNVPLDVTSMHNVGINQRYPRGN